MSVLEIYLMCFNVLICGFCAWVVCNMITGKLQVTFTYFSKTYAEVPDEQEDNVLSTLSPQEKENIREMMEFDQRIAHIKNEIANSLPDGRKGFPARESDGVTNLPHDAVRARQTLVDEVAE